MKTSGKSNHAARMRMCASSSAVMPRECGASSTPRLPGSSTAVSGILDRPVEPGDDGCLMRMERQFYPRRRGAYAQLRTRSRDDAENLPFTTNISC
jgi:hypothetical protein